MRTGMMEGMSSFVGLGGSVGSAARLLAFYLCFQGLVGLFLLTFFEARAGCILGMGLLLTYEISTYSRFPFNFLCFMLQLFRILTTFYTHNCTQCLPYIHNLPIQHLRLCSPLSHTSYCLFSCNYSPNNTLLLFLFLCLWLFLLLPFNTQQSIKQDLDCEQILNQDQTANYIGFKIYVSFPIQMGLMIFLFLNSQLFHVRYCKVDSIMGNEMGVSFKEVEAIMMFVVSTVIAKEAAQIFVIADLNRTGHYLLFPGVFVSVLGIFRKFCILFAILLYNCACAAVSKRMLHLPYLCQAPPFSSSYDFKLPNSPISFPIKSCSFLKTSPIYPSILCPCFLSDLDQKLISFDTSSFSPSNIRCFLQLSTAYLCFANQIRF